MKDNFSQVSHHYAQFRPQYPKEIFDCLYSLTKNHEQVWDVATGNGQVARGLSPLFKKVFATDISEKQIQHAFKAENIEYKVESAEHTSFSDNGFDLITIGQAIHWFHFDEFYKEAKRTAKNNAVIAVIGYHLVKVNELIDNIVLHFYEGVLNGYWDPERKFVDEYYQTIPFPFKEIKTPSFEMKFEWASENLFGFLSSWSATQHFRNKNNRDPLDEIRIDVLKAWTEGEMKPVSFPVFIRAGVIEK
ncbi:MAG: class I SAM-dependent methyltransferase [Chitinophagales bacterium]